jgi:hypothetical protein
MDELMDMFGEEKSSEVLVWFISTNGILRNMVVGWK